MVLLITGASGFVGQSLLPHLSQAYNGLKCLSLRCKWPVEDLANIDVIIHLAGIAHNSLNVASPEDYFYVNTELTVRLFDQFVESNARDFIYISSVKAVAETVVGVLDESASPNPITPYGQSKRKAEQYILSRELPEGKRVIILRPCMIHGPGNKGNLNLLFKVIEKNLPWPFASFENKRSFLSIDNLCFIVKAIIEDVSISSGIYNCADDESIATNELVSLIGESVGIKPKLWRVPKVIVKGSAMLGGTFRLPFDSERLRKLTESYVVSNIKLKKALGIEEFPVSARVGLKRTFGSFRK